LPRQTNSIAARAHHHPAWVAVAGVSRTETQEHSDGHNCLDLLNVQNNFLHCLLIRVLLFLKMTKQK
jgi:hypothetical protein